ncbi:MAG: M28 family peptidase [Dehalococcoidia bacterium]|nr:M28 family peptidase [Dehalococcoidia bacterium]
MPDDELIPTEERIYGWIQEIFRQGVRRPGYPADRWAEQFCLQRFRDLGLQNVRLEPVELPYWEPRRRSLSVWADGRGAVQMLELPCFPLPHSAPAQAVEAALVPFDPQSPEGVKGAIALYDVPLMRSRHATLAGLATWCYDPGATFAESTQVLPFGREVQLVMEPAIAAGAAAFVGALAGYPGDSHDYYVPYDAVARPIPGVWISGSGAARLRELLAAGPARARLSVDSDRRTAVTHNVVGELPGADEELVIIGSHHDGPWSSAVEDGSGISLVLAQAEYWSRLPRERRPHRLVFLLNCGHMAGGAGARAFIAGHRPELERTVLEVHLEHAAAEYVEADGRLQPSGHPEARWWFTSRIPELETAVRAAIEGEDIRRSLVLPPTAFGPRPTTDGGDFHLAGVPIVNFLTAPFYLFDSMDTLDKIHRPSLVPVTRAAVRIIESTAGKTARGLREAPAAR